MSDFESQKSSRTIGQYAGLAARGFAMGAADVVPGVSGGTMALILGIYEELIYSIKVLLSPEFLKPLFRGQLKTAADALPWQFLICLGTGILLAVVTLAKFLKWAMDHHPVLIWSFFFGLVGASIITVSRRLKKRTTGIVCAIITGTVVAYIIVGLVPMTTPDHPLFLFFCGVVAICAMILPGISGSFILLILGKYKAVLASVTDITDMFAGIIKGNHGIGDIVQLGPDFAVLFWVASGCAIGIVTFAQVLSWLLKHYHDPTIAVLIGLLIGSLRKIWPWKQTVAESLDRHGHIVPTEQVNILPNDQILFAAILFVIGFAAVLVIEKVASE